MFVALSGFTTTLSCVVSPAFKKSELFVISTSVTLTVSGTPPFPTVTSHVSVKSPSFVVTVIVATPSFNARTEP